MICIELVNAEENTYEVNAITSPLIDEDIEAHSYISSKFQMARECLLLCLYQAAWSLQCIL